MQVIALSCCGQNYANQVGLLSGTSTFDVSITEIQASVVLNITGDILVIAWEVLLKSKRLKSLCMKFAASGTSVSVIGVHK